MTLLIVMLRRMRRSIARRPTRRPSPTSRSVSLICAATLLAACGSADTKHQQTTDEHATCLARYQPTTAALRAIEKRLARQTTMDVLEYGDLVLNARNALLSGANEYKPGGPACSNQLNVLEQAVNAYSDVLTEWQDCTLANNLACADTPPRDAAEQWRTARDLTDEGSA